MEGAYVERLEFYSNVKDTVRNYLPLGFKQFPVLIQEIDHAGQKTALMTLQGEKRMPVMSLEQYLKSMEQGEKPEQTMIRIGVDYTKHLSRERKASRAYQR